MLRPRFNELGRTFNARHPLFDGPTALAQLIYPRQVVMPWGDALQAIASSFAAEALVS
jgi:hypothetical protein